MNDPNATAAALSVFFVATVPSPGIAVLEGSSAAPRKWDERGGYGLTGATLVFTGNGLGKWDVILSFYEKRDWEEYDAFLKICKRTPINTRPKALDVSHPWLVMNNIYKGVIEDNSFPRQTEAGLWQVVYNWKEWRAPKLTFAKPDGAAATPGDPESAQIQANSALIQGLLQNLSKP